MLSPRSTKPVALLVSPEPQDHTALQSALGKEGWAVRSAGSIAEADRIASEKQLVVVFTAAKLPDGDWKSLLPVLGKQAVQPRLVVASRFADESFWSEVLDLGGFDVLAQPLEPQEVQRIARSAWSHWQAEYETRQSKRFGAPAYAC